MDKKPSLWSKLLIGLVAFVVLFGAVLTWRGVYLMTRPGDALSSLRELERDKIDVERARLKLEKARIADRERMIPDMRRLHVGTMTGLSVSVMASFILVAAGFHRAHVRRASVYIFKIGEHTEVPIHFAQIRNNQLAQERMVLAAAEELRQLNAGREQAIEALQKIVSAGNDYARAHRGSLPAPVPLADVPALPAAIPTFAEMLESGAIIPNALTMGYGFDGIPQVRRIEDLKALAVAGWPGSGKTLSTAYLIASMLLSYEDSEVYVIDPHAGHKEGLGFLLKPLTATGRVILVNPAEAAGVVHGLNEILDQRLTGAVPSSPELFLVVDEMSSMGTTDLFLKHILPFAGRCTEDARKAGIGFVGCSQKWQAKFFGGRADLRKSMPSLLVHKMKPSQADLLLEDSQEKKLVKGLTKSGQALLATSHDADPMPVIMPLITPQDIEYISQHVVKKQVNGPCVDYIVDLPVDSTKPDESGFVDLRGRLDHFCRIRGNFSKMVNDLEIDSGYLSRIRNGKQNPSPEWADRLDTYLERKKLQVIQGGKA